jgi:hypothetical protein
MKLIDKYNALILMIVICFSFSVSAPSKSSKKPGPESKIKWDFLVEKNPHIKIVDMINSAEYVKYKKCQHKTGFLNLLKTENNQKKMFPIYIFLDNLHLKLYSSTAKTSLFNTIKLEEIIQITQQYKDSNCFDLVVNNYNEHISKLTLSKGSISLCSESLPIMQEWISMIQEFKECQVELYPGEGETLYDFSQANKILRQLPSQKEDMFYNSADKAITPKPKDSKISKELKKIIDVVKMSNFERIKKKRQLENEIKTVQKTAKEIQSKERLIEEMIKQRKVKETEKEQMLIAVEHHKREVSLLRAVEEKITIMKKQENKDYADALKKQIDEKRQNLNKRSLAVIQAVREKPILAHPRECYDQRVENFANKQYISDLCYKYFGENGQKYCMERDQFCSQCCNHHTKHDKSELGECSKKCTLLVEEKRPNIVNKS